MHPVRWPAAAPPRPAITRRLAVFAVLNLVVFGLLLERLPFWPPRPPRSPQVVQLDVRQYGRDSWGVMLRASEHLRSPDLRLVYQALFFEEGRKFQYPPTSLLFVDAVRLVLTCQPEPDGQPTDVGIDEDRREAERRPAHHVGGLPPDSRQRQQLVHRIRDAASIDRQQAPADLPDLSGFHAVEADGIDQGLDRAQGQSEHGGWSVGARKEPPARLGGRLIPRSEAEDAGDQDAERIVGFPGDHPDDRLLPSLHFATQNP